MNHQARIQAALAGILALGFATVVSPAPGHAESRHRRSATALPRPGRTTAARPSTPARAKGAKTDNDPTEWKYVAKGTCEKMGGKTSAPK